MHVTSLLSGRRLGIRARLLLVVAATLLLFATTIGVVSVVLRDVAATYERLLDVDERLLLDATRFRLLAELEVSAVQSLVDPSAVEAILAVNREQARLLDELEERIQHPADAAMLERIRSADRAYDDAVVEVAEALRTRRPEVAAALYFGLESPREELLAAADSFIRAKTAARDAGRLAANQRLAFTGVALVLTLLVGGGAAAAVLLGVGGRIARGVIAMAGAIRRIAAGDLGATVPTQHDPELAALAADVEALRRGLRQARDLETRHRERVQLVRDVGRELLAAPDLSAALRSLAERAGRALDAVSVTARLVDTRDGRVVAEARYGMPIEREPDAQARINPEDGAMHGELRVWRPAGRILAADETDLLDALAVEAGLALRNAALAEAASRRAQELDEFVRVVAHDVRGPVALAQRLADLIRTRNPILGGAEAPLFARLGDATAYAEGLIDDLQELARAGRVPTRREAIDIATATEEVVAALGTLLAERGVVAVVRPSEAVVLADRRQLRQVLSNLVENAARHMGETPAPRIEVQAARTGGWCRVGVLDNGRGIPQEQRTRAFLPFRRGAEAEREPGMGIGLAIARRIVESHGGTIWIDASPDGGCAVYFTMPVADVSAEPTTPVETEAPARSGVV